MREAQRKYRLAHPEVFRESSRKYREKNKELIAERQRKYYEEHPERKKELNESRKNYAREHKEEAKRNIETFKQKHNWVQYCAERRKARVERLKAEGVINAWEVCTKGAEPKYKTGEKSEL